MKKMLILLFMFSLAGCARPRIYTVEKPRFDTEVEGNRGYLYGEPQEAPREGRLGPTRRVSVVEFQLGPDEETVRRGIEIKPRKEKEEVRARIKEKELTAAEIEQKAKYLRPPHPEYEYKRYTVQENDTLQKISDKFYGTTRRWLFIFEENRDVLDAADKIYPGMEIRIPILKN